MSAMIDPVRFSVRGIPSSAVPLFWHYAEPYVKRALDHTVGELAVADVRDRCESRDMQLWLIAKGERVVGAGTTEHVIYPRRTHLRIVTLAGSGFDDWVGEARRQIRAYAMERGCDAVECLNRPGFIPKLKREGYKFQYAVMVDELGRRDESGRTP